jgi:hypothetical protein
LQTTNDSKRQLWRSHVDDAKKYSGSVEEFCRSKQITPQSFHYWKKKFAKESRAIEPLSSFIPVEVTRGIPSAPPTLPDPRWLAKLIHHLQSGGVG